MSDIENCVSEIKLWMERTIRYNLPFSNISIALIRCVGTHVQVVGKTKT